MSFKTKQQQFEANYICIWLMLYPKKDGDE